MKTRFGIAVCFFGLATATLALAQSVETQGVTDKEVLIGQMGPFGGPAYLYGKISMNGAEAVFERTAVRETVQERADRLWIGAGLVHRLEIELKMRKILSRRDLITFFAGHDLVDETGGDAIGWRCPRHPGVG